ncbi:3-oxoacyl-[acyl-carrier-protein] reductase [soil metagenome]
MSEISRRLRGKSALVTGSTRGLGRTSAEWLAREGASVVISGRNVADVDATVADLVSSGLSAFGIAADLARTSEAHRLAEETLARVESLDILVNNAGMSIRNNFWDVTDNEWDEQVNANWRSSFILAQHAARHMIEQSIKGRIVNTSTIGARACHTDACVYDSAKGAIETMTRNMAYELGPYGISVNCVAPGNMAERPGAERESWWEPAAKRIPFGRVGRAEDIAAAVVFFCLPESEFITGQTLLVDGGHDTYLPEF